ncbi:MAG: 4Fe-4S binding protein [Frisingicoccus sp.]|uniref:4Fe-4S binding protein n=1 Tax=Lachnospiraceae TaxID=186803 RepID=UPI001F3B4378|nr:MULTISPECIES: 4Fe-4S binding protein [Lachnospiraceae]MCF2553980.1 4Fe-4S binding protein [Faecalicatena contorta]MCF2680602.1 4Fe-4S binding protein [Faecalicatena contorta]MDD6232432.1 4Fe-4S binding protein [Frisingicoccus sp.]
MRSKRYAVVDKSRCVACGECALSCRKNAVSVRSGCFAAVDTEHCVGCGLCSKNCPAGCITLMEREEL